MKIRVPNIEFESFSDGICDIYTENDDDKEPISKYKGLGFTERILGYKRYFTANSVQLEINRLIRIPKLINIDTYDKVKIGEAEYNIILIQDIKDSNPLSIDLNLQRR